MNRQKWLVLAVTLLLVMGLSSCKKKSATGITMLPNNPQLLVSIDLQKVTALPWYDKMVQGDPVKIGDKVLFTDYQDFIKKTGIDPKKDAYSLNLGVYGDLNSPGMVGIFHVRYRRDKLLELLTANGIAYGEEKYGSRTIYDVDSAKTVADGKKEKLYFVFQSPEIIVFGMRDQVVRALDVIDNKAVNALQGDRVKLMLPSVNQKAMAWLLVPEIPAEAKKQGAAGGMMDVDFSKAEAVLGYVDFNGEVVKGEFKLLSKDQAGNEKIASLINMFKGFGAMAGDKEPELVQLINAITVTASADGVILNVSLPQDLIEKLAAKAKKKVMEKVAAEPAVTEPVAEESSEENTED